MSNLGPSILRTAFSYVVYCGLTDQSRSYRLLLFENFWFK